MTLVSVSLPCLGASDPRHPSSGLSPGLHPGTLVPPTGPTCRSIPVRVRQSRCGRRPGRTTVEQTSTFYLLRPTDPPVVPGDGRKPVGSPERTHSTDANPFVHPPRFLVWGPRNLLGPDLRVPQGVLSPLPLPPRARARERGNGGRYVHGKTSPVKGLPRPTFPGRPTLDPPRSLGSEGAAGT